MKNIKKKWIKIIAILAIFHCATILTGNAQETRVSIPIPPSPTAAGLGAYAETPVSTYTGVPSINIPLYEIDAKGFKLPISLAYQATGVRVEDEASWVGLGWSLFAGGVITRSVKGLDDIPVESSSGTGHIGYPDVKLPSVGEDNVYPGGNNTQDEVLANSILSKQYDPEPDVFYFNFLGNSGKFIFKPRESVSQPLEVQLISQQKMQIDVSLNIQTNSYEWVITTVDGNRFFFSTPEKTKSYTQTLPALDWNSDPMQQYPQLHTSAWYLKQIITNKGEIIDFQYTDPSPNGSRRAILKSEMYAKYLYTEDLFPGVQCESDPACSSSTHFYTNSLMINYDVYLKEIRYKHVSIEFSTASREDIAPYNDLYVTNTQPQKLTRMTINRVINGQKELFKFFDFQTDYFESGTNRGTLSKRLRLKSVTEKTASESKPPYVFDYNEFNNYSIADKDSRSKDHWGFYNGKDNTNILTMGVAKPTTIPRIRVVNPLSGAVDYVNGANRECDANYLKIGSLSKITFPTGGSENFDYEPNDYLEPELAKIPHVVSFFRYGEHVPNPPGPEMPSYTLNLSQTTLIEFLVAASVSSPACNLETMDRTVASIINTSTNVPIHITLNFGCNKNDRTNYITELPAGTYNVVVYATPYFTTEGTLKWEEITGSYTLSKVGGGMRIKRIRKLDGITQKEAITNYKYTTSDGTASSGKLMSPLVYDYNWYNVLNVTCQILGGSYRDDQKCYYNYSESAPYIPLSNSANGSAVGYSEVSVELTDGISMSGGKTVYHYLNEPDVFFSRYLPTRPDLSNGLMSRKEEFLKNSQGAYVKIRELEIGYQREDSSRVRLVGMKVLMPQGYPWYLNYSDTFKFYSTYSDWWHKKTEKLTNLPYGEGAVTSVNIENTDFFYENPEHKLLTKTVLTNSDGSNTITKYLRPADYLNANNAVLDEMRSFAHMHDRVIEEIVEIEKGGQQKTKTAAFTEYDYGDLSMVPRSTHALKNAESKSGFVNSLSNGMPNDSDYSLTATYRYDPWSGNVTEIEEEGNSYTTILWGYGNLYPIAKIENARRVDVEAVISGMDLGAFGEGYHSDSEVNSFLAPLRTSAALKHAFITTYTYKPLVGITSAMDTKGMKVYYEYDSFGRLRFEKDQNGNIIKSYDYHYKL
ncbi:hypothetical protein [Pedobacter africanus]|uniref:YD repeat-containing protein n=1 Tax=Pedobacter africanus TaxID=151894 RepID=A0A1W2BPP2_9SPHI|nr:hypothetical protein [Pedobacter africanus]SMC74821.1 hypothetical protein SAMN04488524_2534 [Pedobacter africanus]